MKNQPILIGAHLDHIGINEENQEDPIFNGANDNASGSTGGFKSQNSWLQKSGIRIFW
jgi:Zn-dependent M28 family amino/carboxypeptidase